MRQAFVIFVMFGLFAPGDYQAAIPYFSNAREVTISAPQRQNYFVVDREVWDRSRPDLADLRLYDGENQVPFVLKEKRGGTATEEQSAKVLNLGKANGGTQFDVDMEGMPEYDRLRLQLTAQNFVAMARIEGKNDLKDQHGVRLGVGTLYDFTRENLGANAVLKIPAATWPYLHIEIRSGVQPDQVKGVFVSNLREEKAAWTDAGSCQVATASAHNQTVVSCQSDAAMPVDRIVFQIAPELVNFRRTVTVEDAGGNELARGSITRVRMSRNGQAVVSEELSVDVPEVRSKQIKVTVENADNSPLAIQSTQMLSIERRVYFDAQGKSALKLYFGDPKLGAASYDYATFFHEDADVARAELGRDQANPAYTGRPDDRPWSEKHKAVLWAVMILAVAALALVAIRGLTGPEPKSRAS